MYTLKTIKKKKTNIKHTFMLFYQSLVFVGLAPTTKCVTTQAG